MLDLGRKLNLIEAMINADGQPPRAARLGNVLTISIPAGARARIEIVENILWLSASSCDDPVDVTQDAVSSIVTIIETALVGRQR